MKSNDPDRITIASSVASACPRSSPLLSSLSLSRESRTKEEDGGEGIGIINGDVRPSLLCNVF